VIEEIFPFCFLKGDPKSRFLDKKVKQLNFKPFFLESCLFNSPLPKKSICFKTNKLDTLEYSSDYEALKQAISSSYLQIPFFNSHRGIFYPRKTNFLMKLEILSSKKFESQIIFLFSTHNLFFFYKAQDIFIFLKGKLNKISVDQQVT